MILISKVKLLTLFLVLVTVPLVLYVLLFFNKHHLYNYLVYIKKPQQKIDAIYVFCGILGEYLWRVDAAAEAYNRYSAKEIILFDDGNLGPWVPELKKNLTFVERAQRRLIQKGVPKNHIIILRASLDETWGEAKALDVFLEQHPVMSLLIVTSPYHLRRAYWSVLHNLKRNIPVYTYAPEMYIDNNLFNFDTLLIEYAKVKIYHFFYH